MKEIYLDHCGSTPLCASAREAMRPFLEESFANPSAQHHNHGREVGEHISRARSKIGELLATDDPSILFTASATEANNLMILGFAQRNRRRSPLILCSSIEHKSVLEPCLWAEKIFGAESRMIPCRNGELDFGYLESCLRDRRPHQPALVSVMSMNNELPIHHDLARCAALCREFGAFFHTDASQHWARAPFTFAGEDSLVGAVTLSPHKSYGPKGVGILAFNHRSDAPAMHPWIHGGAQEGGRRSGTANAMAIVGGAAALIESAEQRETLRRHLAASQSAFLEQLRDDHRFRLTVPTNEKVPGIVNFWFEDISAPQLLDRLPHIALNRGSACLHGGDGISHVPTALGLPPEVGANVLRASFGFANSVVEAAEAAALIRREVGTLTHH